MQELPLESERLDTALPNSRTWANPAPAIDVGASAVTTGAADRATATLLLDVIQARWKALEVTDLLASSNRRRLLPASNLTRGGNDLGGAQGVFACSAL